MSSDPPPSEAAGAAPPSPDEPAADAPLSELTALVQDQQRRKRRALLATVGLLVAGGAGIAIAATSMQRQHDRQLAESFGAASRCLWGDVTAEGQSPGGRVRTAQLLTMGIPENQRAEPGVSPWPMRCSPYAYRVKERLADAGKTGADAKALADTAEELGQALAAPTSVDAALTPIVDRFADQAARLGLAAATSPEDVPPPPAGAAPLNVDSLAKGTPISTKPVALKAVAAEHIVDDQLRLLFRESDRGPLLCTFGAGPASSSECHALPASLHAAAAGLHFAGTVDEGAAPIVLGERDGKGGVFRSDTGETISTRAVYGAYAQKGGAVTLLGFDDEKDKLVFARAQPGAALVDKRVDPGGNTGNGYYNLGLLWDQAIWKSVKADENIHMFSRSLVATDALVGNRVDLGQITEPSMVDNKEDEEPHVTGCKTKDALIARVKGWSSQYFLFRTSGQWSFPVRLNGQGGRLTCRGAEATITRVDEQITESGGRVMQARCTAAECVTTSATREALIGPMRKLEPADAAATAAADLDGNLIFLWIAGTQGGLRMRIAPIANIGRARDVVLFDPLIEKGKLGATSTLYDMRLFVRGSSAIVLLNTAGGVYAIRIALDGSASAVTLGR